MIHNLLWSIMGYLESTSSMERIPCQGTGLGLALRP